MLAILSPACAEEHLRHICTGRGRQPELSPAAGLCGVAEMQQTHQGLALWEKRLQLWASFPGALSPGPAQGCTHLQLPHFAQEPRLRLAFVPRESPAFHMAFTVGAGTSTPGAP